MIFNYLKYLQPTWYFNLQPKRNLNYFPTLEQLDRLGGIIENDTAYISDEARERDLAWQAFQRGYIADKQLKGIDVWKKIKLPIQDEYRFLKKNFHKGWVFYVLVLRLISLKNPLKEISGYKKSGGFNRNDYSNKPITPNNWHFFESKLLSQNPLVSIIIPTLNRYEYLKDVFKDLEKQMYKNFEVIVVDQTEDFQEEVYKGWDLDLKYWYQEEKALWKARNEAIKAARGEYILLYDDDSLVEPDWIAQHLKTLDFFNADLSSGVSLSVVGGKVPAHYSYFRWSEQLDTGNVLLKKDVFRKIGLFDRQFEKQRMGDGEFGLRAYLAGYKNISNPYAKRIHLKVGSGGLREMGSWDAFTPKNLFSPRPIPSVLYFARKYHGNAAARYLLMKSLPFSLVPYRFKGNRKAMLIAAPVAVVLFPFVLIQMWLSWTAASKKLRQGAYIEYLNGF